MEKVTVDRLQSIETIKNVPTEQLQWLLDHSEQLQVSAGTRIFGHGEPIAGTYILLEGAIRLCVAQGGEMLEVAVFEPQSITGYLPYSRGTITNGFAEAVVDSTYLLFPFAQAEEMIRTQFELTQALVHIMATRIRDYTAFQQQNEKMMALGKLSAGLAHELNNPAAAVVRSSSSLMQHLKLAPDVFKRVMEMKLSVADVTYVSDKLFAVICKDEKPPLSMMERSSLEDDVLDVLDDYGVENAQEIAENLVDFGFDASDVEDFKNHIQAEAISPVFGWINNNLVTEKIVIDIDEASRRIASLVGAVKNFTHMDQGHGKQYADIHDGIRNTLTMLAHKVKHGNVQIDEQFDTTLPPVNAMIGELNQVWTNLIDNALDAMDANGKGVLQISTGRANECVKVTITDNGPGIPEDVKTRIFDPFFTTKGVGKGTGLGLDVVTRIVKQHKGAIKVNSEPGKTSFIVEFPFNG
ncbi:sensor histidine kinase [Mucilaginibacter myungsuensis]|uniref:histidine kinase n=1 Tax=Mucilaginibacter myungsuensis TaxID=649104 RepID=A0A929PYG1_9SPHI|nr:ATP-binding protein [Mucilaginibacter myungsuensis]MBE9664221.1 cyclic nucleotide-binding domain-containing protein [Mucilaginibacter myungsuensis]MDN3599925.1 ATP-binding protein [Mucilaginibacter myungsuensis]